MALREIISPRGRAYTLAPALESSPGGRTSEYAPRRWPRSGICLPSWFLLAFDSQALVSRLAITKAQYIRLSKHYISYSVNITMLILSNFVFDPNLAIGPRALSLLLYSVQNGNRINAQHLPAECNRSAQQAHFGTNHGFGPRTAKRRVVLALWEQHLRRLIRLCVEIK